jgi:uncharacterized protein YkwD
MDYDVTSTDAISFSTAFTRSVEIRGACRDSRNASSAIVRHSLLVVDAGVQRDSVLLLTNSARSSAGGPGLVLDALLTAVAHAHARDMAERAYFDHTSPEGKTFSQRLRESGASYSTAGENIARNFSAKGAVDAWLNSTGHRQNMLNPAFRRLGVGVFRTLSSPYTYYVQVFTN